MSWHSRFRSDNQKIHKHPKYILQYLFPCYFQNPTDDENQQLKAAEGLFYQEDIFELVMYVGLGVAVAFFLVGILWEFICRRRKLRKLFSMK